MAVNWQIGDRIQNRWEIHDLKRGGMGIVYIVYDHEMHEAFAAKTFHDEFFTHHPVIADRFKQEALAWINFGPHQNVTEARFVLTIRQKPYLFLEYIGGGDLSKWISAAHAKDNLSQVLRFSIQFCDGMTHALAEGITAHRDIKPQNCLVTHDLTLKVTDFGLAKVFADASVDNWDLSVSRNWRKDLEAGLQRLFGVRQKTDSATAPKPAEFSVSLTHSGAFIGTPAYMAPEQFNDPKRVDARADIYSFGVMLFQMVTGKLPFVGNSWVEFERLHKQQQAPSLGERPLKLNRIVQRCLVKDPPSRYAQFGDVRADLAELYEELTGEEAPKPTLGVALDAARWTNKGLSLNTLGRTTEALACYDRALEISTEDVRIWTNKGAALDESGRPEEALACYDRALEINPRDDAAWSNKGKTLVVLERLTEGLACFDRAIEANPRVAQTWINKGITLNEVGRSHEALECFDRALEIDPTEEDTWFQKGGTLIRLRRLEPALACFERVLEINPRNETAWANKGNLLDELGRSQEGLTCYDHALKINPRLKKIWFNKGITMAALGRSQEALACYDRALEIEPLDKEACLNKGNLLSQMGHPGEAIICYDRALEIDPRYTDAWRFKGQTLKTLRQFGEALTCYDRALEIDSRLAEAWCDKGTALGEWGRRDEAIVCYDRALMIDPSFVVAFFNKGLTLLETRKSHEALACFDRALGINPNLAMAWYVKGMILFTTFKRYPEALACFERASPLGVPQAAPMIDACRQMLKR